MKNGKWKMNDGKMEKCKPQKKTDEKFEFSQRR